MVPYGCSPQGPGLGAAAGFSERPLLCSYGAGNEFSFQSRTIVLLCGASYGTV